MRTSLSALVALASIACAHKATTTPGQTSETTRPLPPVVRNDSAAIARAHADSIQHPFTRADIDFVTGMVSHHAQAIVMSRWAPTHGARPSVQTLAGRIINAQQDEIAIMQQWLADRRLPVPDAVPRPVKMMMNGMEHEMWMPGMLTPEQMQTLDAARGVTFDTLFLKDMIQHHRGAVDMVNELLSSRGAAQNQTIFKIANDVQVDQTTEIARMQRMLVDITLNPGKPQ